MRCTGRCLWPSQSGMGWASCASEVRGDGALILVPPEVPKVLLVTGLPGHPGQPLPARRHMRE